MIRLFQHAAAGLLAIAALLVAAEPPSFAHPRETPLAVAQDRDALTSGGLYDPTQPTPTTEVVPQREARPR